MPSTALLGLLLAGLRATTCPPVVEVGGDDAAAVGVLSQSLLRAGIVAVRPGSASGDCAPLRVRLDGHRPPYRLSVNGEGGEARSWNVHLFDLAAAMVEAALDTVAPPEPYEDPDRVRSNLILRTELAFDDAGGIYMGPAAQLAMCGGYACFDLLGRFGTSVAGDLGAATRHDLSLAMGASLAIGDRHAGLSVGAAAGARWSQVRLRPTVPTTVDWPGDQWPFEEVDESALMFAWEMSMGAHTELTAGWAIDAQIVVQHIPEDALRGLAGVAYTSEIVLRMGVGLRWGVDG